MAVLCGGSIDDGSTRLRGWPSDRTPQYSEIPAGLYSFWRETVPLASEPSQNPSPTGRLKVATAQTWIFRCLR